MAEGDIIKDADLPGMGEREIVPGGLSVEDAVPEMPPGSDTDEQGGGLSADDLAQPTSTSDPTGDRATGLAGLRD